MLIYMIAALFVSLCGCTKAERQLERDLEMVIDENKPIAPPEGESFSK